MKRVNDIQNYLYHRKQYKYQPVMLMASRELSAMRLDRIPASKLNLILSSLLVHKHTRQNMSSDCSFQSSQDQFEQNFTNIQQQVFLPLVF